MSAHIPYGIEVCFKTSVVYIIKPHNFSNFWSRNILQTVLEVFDKSNINLNKESENK